ncbi:hypothetical protein TESG_04739 [Trichophyton tonsurans CBS 112818]|uniref:Uncharacterized protein n=1 Tax=Trichophyton tonsurans (strain CBS 112818) TaxID=647933 RepID=F2S179_TRIT1|nr:hypothetical protein TESG_04739 [Trichophyton tonsurans CBS 112818]
MRLHVLVFSLGLLPEAFVKADEVYHKGENKSPSIQHDIRGLASCSAPERDNCSFYLSCLETAMPCGFEGYATAYGDHYCRKFQSEQQKFSDEGEVWLSNTMYCLQSKLVPYATGQKQASCDAIRKYAFGTHPSCYIDNGLCTLPPTDWFVILDIVGIEGLFGSIEALIATLEAGGGCVEFYLWLIRNHFIENAERRITSRDA